MSERYSPRPGSEFPPDDRVTFDDDQQKSDRANKGSAIDRRAALKNIVALGAAMATGSKIRPEHVARTLDVAALKTREIGMVHDVERLRSDADSLKKKLGFSTLEDISPEDLPRFRKEFKDRFSVGVKKIFGTLDGLYKDLGERVFDEILFMRGVNSLYETLRLFGMHGKVYHFFSKRGLYEMFRKTSPIHDEPIEFMKVRVEDFLPNSEQITRKELDLLSSSEYKNALWTQDMYFEQARNLLSESNKDVRDFFNRHNLLPLSAVFSLLKSVIRYRLNEHETKVKKKISDKLLLERLWSERQEFWEEVIIDRETEVVSYFGTEARFGSNEKGFLNTLKSFPAKKNTIFDSKNDKDAKFHVLEKLKNQTGKLALIIDMHGWYDRIDDGKAGISAEEISQALWERIRWYKINHPANLKDALKGLKIIQHTCFPYDFYIAFTQRLKDLCRDNGVDYGKIEPPRVIMSSEPGSVTKGYYMWEAFDKYQNVFKKRHDLRGKDFLIAEPELYYRNGDLTINTIKKGATYQISEILPQPFKPDDQKIERKV